MNKKRKIALVVNKYDFKEAEEADDKYWTKATVTERLQELIELRRMVFGDSPQRIKKIISRRSMYDEES